MIGADTAVGFPIDFPWEFLVAQLKLYFLASLAVRWSPVTWHSNGTEVKVILFHYLRLFKIKIILVLKRKKVKVMCAISVSLG